MLIRWGYVISMSSNLTTQVYVRDITKLKKILEGYKDIHKWIQDEEPDISEELFDNLACLEETNDELADVIYELDKGAY